jgi:hypothetical protein
LAGMCRDSDWLHASFEDETDCCLNQEFDWRRTALD